MCMINSCLKVYNPPERNRLVFKDSIRQVAAWLEEMNQIVLATDKKFYIYGIDSTTLYIPYNDTLSPKVGLLTDSTLYCHKALSFIEASKRKRFIALAKHLYDNFITRCDIENGEPYYSYRSDIYMADYQQDLDRFLSYTQYQDNLNLRRYKILDSVNNLYLLAYKDADTHVGDY